MNSNSCLCWYDTPYIDPIHPDGLHYRSGSTDHHDLCILQVSMLIPYDMMHTLLEN